MVRGRFAVLMQNYLIYLVLYYPNDNYTSLDSQRWLLCYDLKYVDVANIMEVHTTLKFRNCIFFNMLF